MLHHRVYFAQGGLNYGAAEDATFYRMDSGAAHGGAPNYSHMLTGHHPQQSEPHQHMMELLGLLRAVSTYHNVSLTPGGLCVTNDGCRKRSDCPSTEAAQSMQGFAESLQNAVTTKAYRALHLE